MVVFVDILGGGVGVVEVVVEVYFVFVEWF